MTAIEFLEINGLNSIPYRQDVLDVMKEFAIYCCEKQREICAENAETGFNEDGICGFVLGVKNDSIINSPLPEELQ